MITLDISGIKVATHSEVSRGEVNLPHVAIEMTPENITFLKDSQNRQSVYDAIVQKLVELNGCQDKGELAPGILDSFNTDRDDLLKRLLQQFYWLSNEAKINTSIIIYFFSRLRPNLTEEEIETFMSEEGIDKSKLCIVDVSGVLQGADLLSMSYEEQIALHLAPEKPDSLDIEFAKIAFRYVVDEDLRRMLKSLYPVLAQEEA